MTAKCQRHEISLLLLLIIVGLLMMEPTLSFSTTTTTTLLLHRQKQQQAQFATATTTRLFAALPEGYQEFGDFVIRKAGKECGIQKDDDLSIEWKPGKIIVTVKTTAYASAPSRDDITAAAAAAENDDENVDDDVDDDELDAEPSDDDDDEEPTPDGVDVTKLARAINHGLDDVDGVGYAIAETHEIEVTTPGAPEELVGDIMFKAYKGFDVTCEFMDPKTKKIKKIEGRFVEKNDDFTIINIKGRMKKVKNSMVLSVRLPKAKKEKGVK